jgi:hypothetical protein
MQLSLALNDRDAVWEIRERLLARLGPQRDAVHRDPVSQLVNAIISAKTRDDVSSAAFEKLQRRCISWDALRVAAAAEVESIIAPVHHADSKAVHLPQALRNIVASTGSLDLDFLADWDEEAAMQWLRRLPGVMSKVAATVLNFSTFLEFLRQDVVRLRGKSEGPKIAALLEPKTADRTSPRPTVTLRAPGPHINYAPNKGKRYSSNAEGVIENVDADDLAPLLAAGCVLF